MNSKNNIHSIGVIGLGIIGSALSKHIHLSDFQVMGFDIDDQKVQAAIANGVEATKKLANIIEFSEVLITCLPSNKSLDDTVNYLIENNCDSVKIIIEFRFEILCFASFNIFLNAFGPSARLIAIILLFFKFKLDYFENILD